MWHLKIIQRKLKVNKRILKYLFYVLVINKYEVLIDALMQRLIRLGIIDIPFIRLYLLSLHIPNIH